MDNTPVINLVATECQPEIEEKFNKWYDTTHVPLLFKFKGMKRVTRYKIADGAGDYPRYLAIYEFENQEAFEAYQSSPELAAAREELKGTWQGKGFDTVWRVQYSALKTWQR